MAEPHEHGERQIDLFETKEQANERARREAATQRILARPSPRPPETKTKEDPQ
jgi:hypothetical protein